MSRQLTETLNHIYDMGSSSLSNPFLRWLGETFIKPKGLDYMYLDFDPIGSFEEDGIYPVLVSPKLIPADLDSNTPPEVLKHQKFVIEAISEDLMLLDIEVDHNIIPTIRNRRSLDERNVKDRPLIEIVNQVTATDAYFVYLRALLGIAKMFSDDLLRYLYENRTNPSVHVSFMRNDFDRLFNQLTQEGNQTELIL